MESLKAQLRECIGSKDVVTGRRLHAQAVETGFGNAKLIQDLLVQMYGRCGELEEASRVFHSIREPNSTSFNILTAAFARNGQLLRARELFDRSPVKDTVSWNTIIGGYVQQGDIQGARELFERMPGRDLVSWNSIICGYARLGDFHESLRLLKRMEEEGIEPDQVTLIGALDACAGLRDSQTGERVHQKIICSNLRFDSRLANSLMKMYGKCRRLQDAEHVFHRLSDKDIRSWNVMISAYAQNGHIQSARSLFQSMPRKNTVSWNAIICACAQHNSREMAKEALRLFHSMSESSDQPADTVTYLCVLEACSSLQDLETGASVHGLIESSRWRRETKLWNALINMYGKCGSPRDAWRVFLHRPVKDVVSWNSMITALSHNGYNREAIDMLGWMERSGVRASSVTFVSLVDACASLGALEHGRELHKMIKARGHDTEINVLNALMNMYGKCGSVEEARRVHSSMPEKNTVSWNGLLAAYVQNGHLPEARELFEAIPVRDVISWNTMLRALSRGDESQEALLLFATMDLEANVEPDEVTMVTVMEACASLSNLLLGREIYESLASGERIGLGDRKSRVMIWNSLLNLYGKCKLVDEARSVFDCMESRDVVSWTIMFGAYSQVGSIHAAKSCFDEMPEHDVAAWNAMLTCYIQNGLGKEALRDFRLMESRGVDANEITLTSIPEACTRPADPEEARFVQSWIERSGIRSQLISSSVMKMLNKCGEAVRAGKLFKRMMERNVVAWNCMVAADAFKGHLLKALKSLVEMAVCGETPNEVTFLLMLSSCSHGGLLFFARTRFIEMQEAHGIAPRAEHFVCMVDLLARSGRLQDAEQLLKSMPYEPDTESWLAFSGGCNIHGRLGQGAHAAQEASKLDPLNAGPYVLASNLFKFENVV